MLITYFFAGLMAIIIKAITPEGFTRVLPLFGTFAFAVLRLAPLISTVGNLMMQVMGALPNCETVYHIRNENIAHIEEGEKELDLFKSDIAFENVSFAYKGRGKTVQGISVTFKKGSTTAIVGRSGAGKTTIINLLLRLFDVDKGEIKIDGVNIKEYKLSSWLNNIGYVSQDTFILNDTIESNIKFRVDRYSREDVIKAAKYADAHDFISELPNGYDTIVGDKGLRLSGGQAQRIAVARAMIRKPEILIFDEATNNLDNISEAIVQKAIDEISKDHTVIIIAHRLSTIVNADKILVLENGRLMEEGSHEELLEKSGTYWELYQGKRV
jgi:ABC-type multidrug transport system fused ATPase/permease subunit